jgi:hypothetical protein
MRADQTFAPSHDVRTEIRRAIEAADLVVADVTEHNPNVMLEIGYAQARGKKLVLITDDPGTVPFDLSSARVLVHQAGAPFAHTTARLADAITIAIGPGSSDAVPSKLFGRDKAFFSYSHADGEYLQRILIHLRPLERAGALNLWSDTKLRAGDRWRDEIRKAIGAARVAVLLISADFLASEFIVSNELPPLLKAAETEGARIIPVILKPSRFIRDESLSVFQSLNDPKRPVIVMNEAEREELYAKLAELIEVEVADDTWRE